jgi:hypothetical protein
MINAILFFPGTGSIRRAAGHEKGMSEKSVLASTASPEGEATSTGLDMSVKECEVGERRRVCIWRDWPGVR